MNEKKLNLINNKIESMSFYSRLVFIAIHRIFNKKDFLLAEEKAFDTNGIDCTDDLNTVLGQIIYNILLIKN